MFIYKGGKWNKKKKKNQKKYKRGNKIPQPFKCLRRIYNDDFWWIRIGWREVKATQLVGGNLSGIRESVSGKNIAEGS